MNSSNLSTALILIGLIVMIIGVLAYSVNAGNKECARVSEATGYHTKSTMGSCMIKVPSKGWMAVKEFDKLSK